MIAEIAELYRSSKKRVDINWWTEWVCRPPAAVLVYFLRGTNVTPNQLTLASLVIAVAASAMFALLPGHFWLVVAAVVFEVSFILDCADGQLARTRGQTSVAGHLLDFLMDAIKALILLASITYRLWTTTGDEQFLLVGVGALTCLAGGLAATTFLRSPEVSGTRPTAEGQPAVIEPPKQLSGYLIAVPMHAARFIVHYPSYIWLVAAFDRIDLFFYAYAGVHALYFAKTLATLFWRFGRV